MLGEVNTIANAVLQCPNDDVVLTKLIVEALPLAQTSTLNQKYDKHSSAMTNSVASALDDSTPSDSGVQLMDSMSSDMNESFMSNGLDYDGVTPSGQRQGLGDVDETIGSAPILPDLVMAGERDFRRNAKNTIEIDEIAMTKSDIDNSNVESDFLQPDETGHNDITDEMKTSTCSTFDTDAIVFRRKVRKPRTSSTSSGSGSVKKRVSFHEDILKNTKTDNIHIERGFVTYKGSSKKAPYRFLRNSWCSQGQCEDYGDHVCYRNACSDVLDYGQMDVFDPNEDALVQFDNSGVFEYTPRESNVSPPLQQLHQHQGIQKTASNDDRGFYSCKCSDSNSSLESNDNANGNDLKRTDYSRTKSNSCDCIGQTESNKINNNSGSPNMTDNCYFSEPCIETMDEYDIETAQPKSVWCKELKPKSSCLKKTVRDTSVILEHDVNSKVKKFNVHQLSDVNHLFGSIKNIFSTIPERGVPEGCEDLHNVYECVPEAESPMKSSTEPSKMQLKLSPTQEQAETPPGSQSKRKPELSLFPIPTPEEMMHVTIADDMMDMGAEAANPCRPTTLFRTKFIVNCESTVFEHTGVFENTAVQDIPEFPNSSSNSPTPQKQSKSILSFSTAPFKQKLGNFFSSFRSSNSSTKTSSANDSPRSASTQCLFPDKQLQQEQLQAQLKKLQEEQMVRSWNSTYDYNRKSSITTNPFDGETSMTSSIISNSSDKNSLMSNSTISTSTNTTSNQDRSNERFNVPLFYEPMPSTSKTSPKTKTRHLSSPLRRKTPASNFDRTNFSPDLFCGQRNTDENPMVLLSEEFDDLLTVTTTTDSDIIENDIEIVDYSTAVSEAAACAAQMQSTEQRNSNQFLRPPSSKSSLINRFLRNVTQKKINDIAVKKNIMMSNKVKEQPKLFSNLYVKPKKPIKVIQKNIMADFMAEIAHEMEAHSNAVCEAVEEPPEVEELSSEEEFGVGVGEVSIDLFDDSHLHILRDDKEKLIKVCAEHNNSW